MAYLPRRAARRRVTIRAVVSERVQESDEVYLLSGAGTDTVKVRDELMDIKRLRGTTTGSSSGFR